MTRLQPMRPADSSALPRITSAEMFKSSRATYAITSAEIVALHAKDTTLSILPSFSICGICSRNPTLSTLECCHNETLPTTQTPPSAGSDREARQYSAALGPRLNDPGNDVGEVTHRIDVVDLAVLDQRCVDYPIFGAAIGAREQRIFSGKCDRSDRSFDNVVVEFDAAAIDEERQPSHRDRAQRIATANLRF
jgi:hypothetical protein